MVAHASRLVRFAPARLGRADRRCSTASAAASRLPTSACWTAWCEQFREHTADVWYSKTAEELMGPGCTCAKCGGTAFRKETDILDVWFDSGSSHLAVLTPENGLPWPADMYLEGGDQYRGWFQSSLLVGVGLKGGAPYRECATHGWTLDAKAAPCRNRSATASSREEIIKKYGADLLRLWVASVDFMEDVRISDTILTRLSEAYRKLRNTASAICWAISTISIRLDDSRIRRANLPAIDAWILVRAEELVRRCLDLVSANMRFTRSTGRFTISPPPT